MKIVIFGLGYVGVTTAACLARDGHLVVGIYIDADKVATVGAGRSPVSEPGVAALLADAHAAGRGGGGKLRGGLQSGIPAGGDGHQ